MSEEWGLPRSIQAGVLEFKPLPPISGHAWISATAGVGEETPPMTPSTPHFTMHEHGLDTSAIIDSLSFGRRNANHAAPATPEEACVYVKMRGLALTKRLACLGAE